MKNNNLLLILVSLFALPLVACNEPPVQQEISPVIKTALNSLKGKSHKVNIKQTVSVLRPIPEGMTPEDPQWNYLPLDLYQEYNNTFGYYYQDDGTAFSRKTSSLYADLDKLTGEFIPNSVRQYDNPQEIFWKDNQTGTVYTEKLSIQNELSTYTSAYYDEETGIYLPIVYDSEFKNPFDFITYRDFEFKDDGKTLRLINDKEDFLAECYNSIGMNFIEDTTIKLDSKGRISSIEFVIPDLVSETYTRKNTISLSYEINDDIKINHLKPFENNNPELQNALDVLDNQKNFTYIKELSYDKVDAEGNVTPFKDRVKGYFTEDEIYFHHETSDNDTHPYINGDDYDYKSIKNDDVTYTCYEYTPDGYTFDWKIVMLSSSAPYIIDSFAGIGPSFMDINASIFAKTEENTYDIEPELLSTSGKYFDFQMYGVQSAALESTTTQITIKLNNEGNIEYIESAFVFNMTQYHLKYYIQDIGTTEIPEWSYQSLPVPDLEENA